MPLIPADTTYTRCLTTPSSSTNLCDSNEQTNQTPGHRPVSRRLDRCDRVIQKESGDPNGANMCSVSGATGTSRVRHNAHYVPYAQIRFDNIDGVYVRESPASLSIAMEFSRYEPIADAPG